jgi:hypothetical protein
MKPLIAIASSLLFAQAGDPLWVGRLAFGVQPALLGTESRLRDIDSKLNSRASTVTRALEKRLV